uniref:non-specific serine/threonine protein kinase n=1 Tax=Heterorhabditis bacteriophora TaxID=37862 RepID=A0A1I7X8U2_HETBA
MASLQVEGSMLETSCGSPHYACPEVIRGEKYDGRKADVWSCGVILYALLVGALPFDDDNLRNLLEKVKKGVFHIPHFVPADVQSLLRAMIEVDPSKRFSLAEVFRHPWVAGTTKNEPELELPMAEVVQTHVIPSEDSIDPDVFRHMNSLGCFKDKQKLINELLSSRHNTEKMVYFLLLDRKRRRPAQEDETEIVLRGTTQASDPPKKRTDSARANRYAVGSIADGSPINPRKTYGSVNVQKSNFPQKMSDSTVCVGTGSNASSTHSIITGNSQTNFATTTGPWRSKLTNIKNSFLGTPRFHRRRMSNGTAESDNEESQMIDTSDLVKKSWFGSLTSSMSVERDDTHCVPVQGKTLNAIKAELIRTFLTIHELSHSVVGQNCFRVEYKRGPTVGGSVFSRGVKMNVDIMASPQQVVVAGEAPTYVVQFTLLAGPVRRFKRLVEHLSSILQNSTQQRIFVGCRAERAQQAALMVRPRRLSDSSVSSACSDTESNASMNILSRTGEKESGITVDPYSQSPSMRSVGSSTSNNASTFKSPTPQRRNTTALIESRVGHLTSSPGPMFSNDFKLPSSIKSDICSPKG